MIHKLLIISYFLDNFIVTAPSFRVQWAILLISVGRGPDTIFYILGAHYWLFVSPAFRYRIYFPWLDNLLWATVPGWHDLLANGLYSVGHTGTFRVTRASGVSIRFWIVVTTVASPSYCRWLYPRIQPGHKRTRFPIERFCLIQWCFPFFWDTLLVVRWRCVVPRR